MITPIETHVRLDVPNLKTAREYLEDTLGLPLLRSVVRPEFTVAWYSGLELWQAEDDGEQSVTTHVAWQVDNIDATVERLRRDVVTFDTEEVQAIDAEVVTTNERVRYIFFDTPLGVKAELYEVKPSSN